MSNAQKLNFQKNMISQINEEMSIKDYKIIKRIGFGSSGLVYKVTKKNDSTNKLYILKQIPYSEPNLEETTKKVQSAKNEALILSKLSCKYIVKYYNSFVDSENNLNIIMEYCDSGDLNSFICNLKKENKYLNEEDIWYFFIQISLGLAYIHSKNILHRDLKPMNIFLTNKNQIKIGDLGVAKLLSANANASTCIGTPYYLSPEICKEKPYNSKGDVWALGCILYELCTFNKPFVASNPAALILKIINGNYIPLNEIKNGRKYSEELQYMIENILQKDDLIRPLMKDIINSNIFREKAISFGFGEDLENILSLYDNNDININNNKENEFKSESFLNYSTNKNNENNNRTYIFKKGTNFSNQKKMIFYKNDNCQNSNNNSFNNAPLIHSMNTKKNYLSTGRSTNDSSHNYDKNYNLNTNSNFYIKKQNEFQNSNSNNNQIKTDLLIRPKTKYIKYINKKKENESSSKKKKIDKNIFNNIKQLNYKDTNNIELKQNKRSTKLKTFQISPKHFRDSSGGRYNNQKKFYIMNNFNYYGSLSSKKKINSKEKKYINNTKNIIYNNLYNSNNKNYLNMIQNINKFEKKHKNNLIQIKNPSLINNNIKIMNINNISNKKKIINYSNEENIPETNINNIILQKKIINEPKSPGNIVHNSKENHIDINRTNLNYQNYCNKYNFNKFINLNNITNHYSLNFIGKTRSDFYNKNFSNIQEPANIMKMNTQNNFNNLNNFRIENGISSTKNNINNGNYEKNNINENKSPDSSDEHSENNNNDLDEEIIEDSGLEDEDVEEKVSIVKEKNNYSKEAINKKKEEYLKLYNECNNEILQYKNKILQYKNIIDIHKLFSLYEKISKNKAKIDDNDLNEIDDYMKNSLNKEIYPKFKKLFYSYIFCDYQKENLDNLQRKYD